MNLLRRLWSYWWETIQFAREAHDNLTWCLGIALMVFGFILRQVGISASAFSIDDFGIYLGGVLTVWGVLWLPVRRHEELTERCEPKMDVECGRFVDGSRPKVGLTIFTFTTQSGKTVSKQILTQWLRVVVYSRNLGSIKNARVQLTRIQKSGDTEPKWAGESEDLTFIPGDRQIATREEIPDGGKACVDVFAISAEGHLLVGTQGRGWRYLTTPLSEIFGVHGDYILTLLISGEGTKSKECRLVFRWTGDYETSELNL